MTRIRCRLPGVLAFAAAACALQADSSSVKLIDRRIHKLRSLAGDVRAAETKKLALEIRALSDRRERLPLSLSDE